MSENKASQSKKSFPVWLTLALVCVIVAGVLGLTNLVTMGPIAYSAAAKVLASMQEAFPTADEFVPIEIAEGASVQECTEAYENGELIGYIARLTVTGCKGPIEIQAGYDLEGKITAFTCGGSNFQETAGLGSKVKDAAFRDQFTGKSTPLAYGNDGIDSITGATISSGAVLSGLNTAGYFVADLINPPAESNAPEDLVFGGVLPGAETKEQVDPAPEGMDEFYTSNAGVVAYVTGQGRNGTVQVQVGVANSGQVSGVYIDHEKHSETAGLGDAIENAYFTNRFLGLDSSALDGVDTISGATISSTCVKDCVKKAVEAAQPYLDESAAFDISEWFSGAAAEEPVDEAAAAAEEAAETAKAALDSFAPFDGRLAEFVNAAYTDGDRVVSDISVPGLLGDINLIIGVDPDGKIDEMTAISHNETPGLGAPQLTPDALAKLVGADSPDAVDVVSGASTTSGALQKAVVAACGQYDIVTGKAPAEEPAPVEEEPAAEPDSAEEAAPAAAEAELAEFVNSFSIDGDRVISDISVPGLLGDINLIVGVGPDGKIDEIKAVSHNETPGLGAPQLEDEALAKLIGADSPDAVDVVSGASTTSAAVQKAVTAACEQFALAAAAPADGPVAFEGKLAEFVNSALVDGERVISDISVPGLLGDINLTVGVGPDGKIDEIKAVSHNETPGLGAPQLEDEALANLIGTDSPDAVDVVSGASTTSGAIQKAVTAACEQFAIVAESKSSEAPEASAESAGKLAEFVNSVSVDGDRVISDISVPGLLGNINLIVGVGPDGKIDEIKAVSHNETPGLGAPQLEDEALAKLIGSNSPDAVDVVTGASTTSAAIQKAVTAACEQYEIVKAG